MKRQIQCWMVAARSGVAALRSWLPAEGVLLSLRCCACDLMICEVLNGSWIKLGHEFPSLPTLNYLCFSCLASFATNSDLNIWDMKCICKKIVTFRGLFALKDLKNHENRKNTVLIKCHDTWIPIGITNEGIFPRCLASAARHN